MQGLARKSGRFSVVSFLLLLLVACGGGDGNGDGNDDGVTPPPPPSTGISVTGTAGKGLLANAPVSFHRVSSGGTAEATAVASTRTNNQGVFAATVDATGPVVVTVSADSQTTMLDELSGASSAVPANLALHAVVPALTTTPIAVTPLTEMAYAMAGVASGGLTVTNIDAANSAVSGAMLDGAPILSTLPIDLAAFKSATVAQQAQAKLLTAMALAAKDGIAVGPTGVACVDAEYNARLLCMVGGLKNLLTVGASNTATFAPAAAYLSAAYKKINAGLATVLGGQAPATLGLSVQTNAERTLMLAVTNQVALLGYNPGASPLANTKAMFADLRTNIIAQQQGADIFGLAPVIDALDADFQGNVVPVLTNTRAVLVAGYTAAAMIDAGVADSYEWASGHVVCGYDPVVLQTAANAALCRYGEDDYEDQVLMTVTRTAVGTYGIATQPLAFDPSFNSGSYNPIFRPYFGQFSPSASFGPLAATFTRNSSAGGALSVAWQGPYYVNSTGGQVSANLEGRQSDDWAPETLSGSIRVGGSVSGGAGGISLVEATISSDSEVFVQNGVLGADTVPTLYGSLGISRLATASYVYAAQASIGKPVYDKQRLLAVPEEVSVVGSVSQIAAGGAVTPLFNGSISLGLLGVPSFDSSQPIGPTNTFGAQAQVVGNLALPNGRVLAVSVAANGNEVAATPTAPYSLSATYAYSTPAGEARINISGKYDEIAGYSATITTNTGVSVVATRSINGAAAGTVTANGVTTATIADTTINYSDGTTESLY